MCPVEVEFIFKPMSDPALLMTIASERVRVVSTVDGKEPGEPGHPIQYDTTDGWYVNVGAANSLRSAIVTNQGSVSVNTNNTFIVRKPDTRKDLEKIYRIRFVVPDDSTNAAAPTNGFTIQESATFIDDTYYCLLYTSDAADE